MPNVIIGIKKWMTANRKIVEGMLARHLRGRRPDQDERRRAAAGGGRQRARLQGEGRGLLVQVLHASQTENDKQGLAVELGGSSVNNLADNLQLFGLAPGSTNLFAATYTVFGNIVKSQYPSLVPSFYPVAADPRHLLRQGARRRRRRRRRRSRPAAVRAERAR